MNPRELKRRRVTVSSQGLEEAGPGSLTSNRIPSANGGRGTRYNNRAPLKGVRGSPVHRQGVDADLLRIRPFSVQRGAPRLRGEGAHVRIIRDVKPGFWLGGVVVSAWSGAASAKGGVSGSVGLSPPCGIEEGRSPGAAFRWVADSTADRSWVWVCWICFNASITSLIPAVPPLRSRLLDAIALDHAWAIQTTPPAEET